MTLCAGVDVFLVEGCSALPLDTLVLLDVCGGVRCMLAETVVSGSRATGDALFMVGYALSCACDCDCDCDARFRVRVDFPTSASLPSPAPSAGLGVAVLRDFGCFWVVTGGSAGLDDFATRAAVDATLVRFGRGIDAQRWMEQEKSKRVIGRGRVRGC